MQVSIVTEPSSKALLTRTKVKAELGLTGTTDDVFLDNLIMEVSEAIYSYAGRPLYRAVWRETQEATVQSRRLLLSRYPVLTVEASTFNGAAQSVSMVTPEAGILYANTGWYGWGWSSTLLQWSFDYCAGWLLPGDAALDAQISVASTDNSYNGSGLFPFGPLMRAGDVVVASGFASASNNGYKTVASTPTTSKIIVSEVLVANVAATASLSARNLPGWIERSAQKLLSIRYHGRDRDPSIASIEVGQAPFSFKAQEAEDAVRKEITARLGLSLGM